MYILIKSASDDTSFTTRYVDGKVGHHYTYAEKMAKEVTEAMAALREVRRLFGPDWQAEIKLFESVVKEL